MFYTYLLDTGQITKFSSQETSLSDGEGGIEDGDYIGTAIKCAVGADNPVPYRVDTSVEPHAIVETFR